MADQSMNGEDFSQDINNGEDQAQNGGDSQQNGGGGPAKDDDR